MNKKIKTPEEYYSIKNKYQKKVDKVKNEIQSSDLSDKEKHLLWKNSKFPCIQCKNLVNTFFSERNRKLTAVCGAVVQPVPGITPCNLDISIDLPSVNLLDDLFKTLKTKQNKIKEQIIITKLDYLFKFNDEASTIDNFEEQKKTLALINADYEKLFKIYETRYSINVDEYKKELEQIIQDIKDLINSDSIEEAITMQINKLQPLIELIRNKSYKT